MMKICFNHQKLGYHHREYGLMLAQVKIWQAQGNGMKPRKDASNAMILHQSAKTC
jgi:hypothetical protein